MKRIILLTALAGLLLTACGPQTYTKYMHVRQPSRSGMDLSKRTMSVVYLSDKDSWPPTSRKTISGERRRWPSTALKRIPKAITASATR